MLRIATIGTSMITDDFIQVVNANDQAAFVGTLSRDANRGTAFTAERGGERNFTSLDELAAAADVDAVYIGSPNALHYEQALACIAGGKHVIVEKPFCATEAQALEVFRAAEAAGVVALEAMRPLHDPAFHAVEDALGEIAPIRRASLRFGKYSSRYNEILAGRATNIFDCNMASGSLMDIGVYTVEPMVEIFGMPSGLTSMTTLLDPTTRQLTHGPIDGWKKRGWKTANKQPVKNRDLWERLLTAKSKHKVEFVWVKGHAGHELNERCDELATTAADGSNLDIDTGFNESDL